jgi:hypothetical protein
MTSRVTDDELQAMLEERAGVSAGAAREVLAAARAEIAGPIPKDGKGVSFGVRPVAGARRRSRMSWGVAAMATAAVLVVAVVGARLGTERPTASGVTAGASPAAVVGTSPSAAASPVVASPGPESIPVVSFDTLLQSLNAGSLDGRLVLVEGRPSLVTGDCPSDPPGQAGQCTWVRIDGLGDTLIDNGGFTHDQMKATIDGIIGPPITILRGNDGGLDLVGWLTVGLVQPIGVGTLGSHIGTLASGSLALVDGWLIPGSSVSCPDPNAACPGSMPWLTAVQPLADGTPVHGTPGYGVSVDPSLQLGGPTDALAGPFLVKEGSGPAGLGASFEVVGRFDSQMVAAGPQPAEAGAFMSAADLAAALKHGSPLAPVIAIDGTLTAEPQGCDTGVPPACALLFLDGLPDVGITWSSGGLPYKLGLEGPLGSPPPATHGRFLVTPVGKHLELIGVLDGDLERPVTVQGLPATGGAPPDPSDVVAVHGWLVDDGPIFCAFIPAGGTPCPQFATLSDQAPDAGGTQGSAGWIRVLVDPAGPGIGKPPMQVEGSYLVRRTIAGGGQNPVWTVVGRYVRGAVPVVVSP